MLICACVLLLVVVSVFDGLFLFWGFCALLLFFAFEETRAQKHTKTFVEIVGMYAVNIMGQKC